jgi:hypothetical protein
LGVLFMADGGKIGFILSLYNMYYWKGLRKKAVKVTVTEACISDAENFR